MSNFDGREPHYSIEGRNEKKVGEEDGEDEKETSRDLFELTAYISGKVERVWTLFSSVNI